jgi:hypothetical protein
MCMKNILLPLRLWFCLLVLCLLIWHDSTLVDMNVLYAEGILIVRL